MTTDNPFRSPVGRRLACVTTLVTALAGLALVQCPQGISASPERLTARAKPSVPAAKPIAVGDEIRTDKGQRRRVALKDGSVLYVNQNTTAKLAAGDRLTLTAGEVFVEAAQPKTSFVVETPKRTVTASGARFAVRTGAKGTGVIVARGTAEVSGLDRAVRAGEQLAAGADDIRRAPRTSHLLDWTRDLMAAAETPLVPPSPYAGGALVAIDPDGQEAKLSLRKCHIDVHIEDGFARTTIDQTYFNHEAARLEGTFYFPLPPDASLSRLAMYVDGKLMEGGMAERDYARQVYETILYRQKDPALLEWVDGSTFKMRVFPLEARQEKRILLSYTQKLATLYGQAQYRFPAGHSLGSVRDWSFHARVKHAADLGWSSGSHTLRATKDGADLVLDAAQKNVKADRDVTLLLSENAKEAAAEDVARFATAEHEGARYLMLRYRPQLLAQPHRQRRDWVVLFESSGDRDPLLARTQIDIVRSLLTQAEPVDTFAVLAAGTRVHAWAGELRPVTPANVQAAVAFLEGTHLIGALDLGRAFQEAGPLLLAGKDPYLVHVGSGIAAMGEHRQDVLVRRLPERARYVGIGVGNRWERSFMKAAAERSGGYFTQINPDEPISWRAFELSATLNTPRLLDVGVADAAGKATFLNHATSLAQGEELCAIARLDPEQNLLPESVTVTGTLDGQPFRRVVPVRAVAEQAAYLPRTWARLEIDRLLAEDAVKHKPTIVALSKAMYVMTPFTSLLVLENEDMYVQYKVDRGRKDHWAMYGTPARIPLVYEPLPGMPVAVGGDVKERNQTGYQVCETVLYRGHPQVLGSVENIERRRQEALARPVLDRTPATGGPATGFTSDRADAGGVYTGIEFALYHQSPAASGSRVGALGLPMPGPIGFAERRLAEANLERLGEVFIVGNDVTRENVIRRQVSQAPEPPPAGVGGSDFEYYGKYRFTLQPAAVPGTLARGRYLEQPAQYFPETPAFPLSAEPAPVTVPDPDARFQAIQTGHAIRLFSAHHEYGSHESVGERLVYKRPTFTGDDRIFYDLVAYTPGMDTSWADVQAVVEAEAVADPRNLPGQIDPAARKLIDQARAADWQAYTIPAAQGRAAFTIRFDGSGRYAYERTLPPGIRERVVCDGKTLLHLYPDLGIGARRSVSRFHRAEFAGLVPWVVPTAEDLAHGADVKLLDEHTVAIIPRQAEAAKDTKGKAKTSVQLHLVFGDDGRLTERRIVEMPSKKTLARQLLTADGVVKVFGKDSKEPVIRTGTLAAATAPNLLPGTKKLVVLPLPYRTREQVRKSLKIENTRNEDLRFEDALALFAAEFATQSGSEVVNVFQQAFHGRDQRQLGFYVLLAACGQNLDAEHVDVLAEHPNEPLAQYLALYSSPVLRKHASQWAVGTGQWAEGFLRRLAVSHALNQRWQGQKPGKSTAAERAQALEHVRQNSGSVFGWALLCLLQDQAGKDADFHRSLVPAWKLFADVPGLAYAARYEHARSQWKAGQRAEARQEFRELYEKTLADGVLPAVDADFRQALAGTDPEPDQWSGLLRTTGQRLIEQKRRPAVLALAWQCWQLDDQPLANALLTAALERLPDDKDRVPLTLAAIDFLVNTSQLAQADQLLQKLLADPKLQRRAALWRLAADIADKRERKARQLLCLERALDAEYQDLPAVVDLKAVRNDYGRLLDHYQSLADAMAALEVKPPADFRAKVIRTADRWRALDSDGGQACESAARILHTLGEQELVWDYLTTPVGLRPRDAEPWVKLAQTLGRRGDLELADRAYAAAFDAEPTNAQVLWERAQNLRHGGRSVEAHKLLRQLTQGTWQPRFHWIQAQARRQVNEGGGEE